MYFYGIINLFISIFQRSFQNCIYIYINDNIFLLVDCDLDVVWG